MQGDVSLESLTAADIRRSGSDIPVRADAIARARFNRPKYVQRMWLDLGASNGINNPLNVSFPFDSFEVIAAYDATSATSYVPKVKMVLGSKEQSNMNNYRECVLGDAVELNEPVNEAQIYWDVQTGSQMYILFYLGLKARTSVIQARITGGITQSDGSQVNSKPFVNGATASYSPGASAGVMLPANSSRQVTTMRVTGGDIRIGDSNIVAGTTGLLIPSGTSFTWRNIGSLYAIAESGAPVVTGIEEQ